MNAADTPTMSNARLAALLRAQAIQIAKAPEKRHEDFEDAAVAWALRLAANRLLAFDKQREGA
jgi:hypothetical protein